MRKHVTTVVLAFVFTAGFCGYWLKQSNSLPAFGDTYKIRADVPRSSSLVRGSSVRMAGLEVGHVTDVTRKGSIARITLHIDRKHGAIPVDSRIGVRVRSLIGENYVSIYPGRASETHPSGGLLPLKQSEDFVDVDEILSVLQGDTREQARQLIRGLGKGVEGRGGKLNVLLRDTTRLADNGVRLVDTLEHDRVQVSRLVDNFGRVMQSVGERGAAVRDTARGLRETFVAVSNRDEALREVFRELPPTMERLRATTRVIGSTSDQIAPSLASLASAVRAVGPAVTLLRPAATEGDKALRELSATVPPLTGTLKRVRNLADPAAKALPEVTKALCEAVPALDYASPYGRDVASFIQNVLATSTNYYDATGHSLRLGVSLSETALMGTPRVFSQAEQKLLNAGILKKIHLKGYDPYPGPGKTGSLVKGAGVSGPEEWPYKYERVVARC